MQAHGTENKENEETHTVDDPDGPNHGKTFTYDRNISELAGGPGTGKKPHRVVTATCTACGGTEAIFQAAVKRLTQRNDALKPHVCRTQLPKPLVAAATAPATAPATTPATDTAAASASATSTATATTTATAAECTATPGSAAAAAPSGGASANVCAALHEPPPTRAYLTAPPTSAAPLSSSPIFPGSHPLDSRYLTTTPTSPGDNGQLE